MGSYAQGFASVAAAAGAAYATIHTAAGARARIREIGLFCNAATASSVQLVRAATGTASTSVLGQAEDPADAASVTNIDTAWSVAPTISTNVPLRRVVIPAVIGAGVIWTWPIERPLVIAVSSMLVIWNFGAGAGSVLNGYAVWEE